MTGLRRRLVEAWGSARSERDRGSISMFFVIAIVALFVMVGLVVDGGGQVRSLERANDIAAQAARQGAQAIDAAAAIRGRGAIIDPSAASQAAQSYLAAAGVPGTVVVDGADQLTVTTTTTYTTTFLGAIGISSLSSTGHATVDLREAG